MRDNNLLHPLALKTVPLDKLFIKYTCPPLEGPFRTIDSKTKHYGSLVQPYGVPREWGTDDVDQLFKNFSMSAGLGFHYVLNRIDFGIESWFGLMNLSEIDAVDLKVKENNFRLLFGYKF